MRPKIQPTLLILAAGMGSRYGGLKRMDPVGSSGEMIFGHLRRMLSAFLKTHDHNDRTCVIECIRALFARGDYPQKLWT